MAENALKVRLVSPERVVFEGEARGVVAPAWDGLVGILRGHAPMITLLGAGRIVVQTGKDQERAFHVAGGLLKVESDQITALTEYASDEAPPADLVERLRLENANLSDEGDA